MKWKNSRSLIESMWKLNKNVNKALVLSKHTAVITVLTILLLFLSAGHPFTIFWVLVGYFSLLHRLDGTFCSSLGSVYAIRGTKPRLGQSHLLSLESEAQEARDTRIPTSLSIPAAWTSPHPPCAPLAALILAFQKLDCLAVDWILWDVQDPFSTFFLCLW